MIIKSASVLLLSTISLSALGSETIYSWTDSKGQRHYSDQRPQRSDREDHGNFLKRKEADYSKQGWKYIASEENYKVYVRIATSSDPNGIAKYQTLYNYSEPQYFEARGKYYESIYFANEIKCKTDEARNVAISFHQYPFGEGNSVYIGDYGTASPPWDHGPSVIRMTSSEKILRKYVCQK